MAYAQSEYRAIEELALALTDKQEITRPCARCVGESAAGDRAMSKEKADEIMHKALCAGNVVGCVREKSKEKADEIMHKDSSTDHVVGGARTISKDKPDELID